MPILKKQQDQSFRANIQSNSSAQRNYSVISYQERIKLIKMVCVDKMQIIDAAPALGIRISTAKYILGCFRKNGKIFKKCCQEIKEKEKLEAQFEQLKMKIAENDQKNKKSKKNLKNKKNKNLIVENQQQLCKQIIKQNVENNLKQHEKPTQDKKQLKQTYLYYPSNLLNQNFYFPIGNAGNYLWSPLFLNQL